MIQSRNKIDPNFNTASMSDLVFLLLIFFMLTSTLISPNAIKLLLPQSTSGQTMAKQNVNVSINDNLTFFVENVPVTETNLQAAIASHIEKGLTDATIKLHADKSVAIEYVVKVIDAVNLINAQTQSKHKVILATQAAK
ncbi:MAG: biopolymer transporter ExbD [Bacteroidales bacterium]|jgi:biopolymer transport protein ExbD|nr:biopolymer transporter ExbD [Bacteroidales bacterium]